MRLSKEDETLYAQNILQQAQVQGANWITGVRVERNRQNQSLLLVDAPIVRSSEINALLARQNLFAAEIHPREGSLEEVFLQLTGQPAQPGQGPRVGMVALADAPPMQYPTVPGSELPSGGKRGTR